MPGVVLLDQFSRIPYWTFDRDGAARRFDPHPLRSAVTAHWLARGRDVSLGGGYYLEAVGWEGPAVNRIVFKALRRLTHAVVTAPSLDRSPEQFLGYWSTELTGSAPRLLAEKTQGFVVPRFGRFVAAPPKASPPPSLGVPAAPTPR